MGGVSQGRMTREVVQGREAVRLTGDVSLENNGGFIQMAFDTAYVAGTTGITMAVLGNGESYDLRLRTTDLIRPWQSYVMTFVAKPAWTTLTLPFDIFQPYRTDVPFDPTKLRRVGVVAVGRAFQADVAVADFGFYA